MNKKILICAVFAMFACVYMTTVAPTYNSDDSPETTVAYKTLGIQHPPGYPLATLIGKVFDFIPLGSAAFRANLMAAVFNLLAGLMIFLLTALLARKMNKGDFSAGPELAGLTAAAFFIFSGSAWLQGSIAKGSLYSLNAFLLASCVYALLRGAREKKYFYLFSFLYGLSMGNHWTSMAVIAPAILYLVFTERKKYTLKDITFAAIFLLLGAGVYFYVWVRNAAAPCYAWGDVRTLKEFLWLVTRAQYAGIEVKHTLADTAGLVAYYFKNLFTFEYPFGLAVFFIPGAAWLAVKARKEGITLALSWALITLSVASFATPPANTSWLIKPYLVSTNVFIGIWSALFLYMALLNVKKESSRLFLLGAALCLVFLALFASAKPDYSRYFIGYDFSNNLVKSIKPDSVIFLEGDMNVGGMLYKSLVDREKFVPLIPVVIQYGWYQAQVKRNYPGLVEIPRDPLDVRAYLTEVIRLNPGRDFYYSNVFTKEWIDVKSLNPEGMVMRIKTDSRMNVITDMLFRQYSLRGLIGDYRVKYDEFTRRLVVENYAMAYFNLADALRVAGSNMVAGIYYEKGLLFSRNHGAYINAGLVYYSAGRYDKAEKMWRGAIETGPEDSTAYSNMAFIYAARKELPMAKEFLNKALRLNPNNNTAIQLRNSIDNMK